MQFTWVRFVNRSQQRCYMQTMPVLLRYFSIETFSSFCRTSLYHNAMLTAASCSISSLCAVIQGLILHIYIYIYIYIYVCVCVCAVQAVCKGIYSHICVYAGHICIYKALKTYIQVIYICFPYLFVCFYALYMLHICKYMQINANACSIAHQCSP